MSKLNNKSIVFSLKILTILAFVLIFVPFNRASAAYGSNITYCGTSDCESFPNYNYNNPYYNNAPYQAPIYVAPQSPIIPVIHSNTTNPSPVMTVNYTPTKTVAVAKKSTPKTVATTATPDSGSALAANAVYGSNGFLPSGIIQWILFAIATLLIVILARTVFGAKAAYHAAPLKYE